MGHQALREGPPLIIKIDGSSGFARNPAPTLIFRCYLNLRQHQNLYNFIIEYLWDTIQFKPNFGYIEPILIVKLFLDAAQFKVTPFVYMGKLVSS